MKVVSVLLAISSVALSASVRGRRNWSIGHRDLYCPLSDSARDARTATETRADEGDRTARRQMRVWDGFCNALLHGNVAGAFKYGRKLEIDLNNEPELNRLQAEARNLLFPAKNFQGGSSGDFDSMPAAAVPEETPAATQQPDFGLDPEKENARVQTRDRMFPASHFEASASPDKLPLGDYGYES